MKRTRLRGLTHFEKLQNVLHQTIIMSENDNTLGMTVFKRTTAGHEKKTVMTFMNDYHKHDFRG